MAASASASTSTARGANGGRRRRIVILGGGFGGAYAARTLGRAGAGEPLDVTLVDRNNFFIFTPLLVEAGTGALEPRHAVVSLRTMIGGARFVMGRVGRIDFDAQRIGLELDGGRVHRELEYDHLVIALGSQTMLPPVPGLAEHGFELKSLADAVALRDRAIRHLELADAVDDAALRRELLHLVVVGGSYSGVEVAGEFEVFLKRAAGRYPNVSPGDVRVTLVEMQQRVLPTLDADLADYARQTLESRGVRIELNHKVGRVGEHEVELDDGRVLDSRTCIWTAGIAPPRAVADLDLPKDQRGYIECEPDLRVKGYDNVWAIGDCAVNHAPDGSVYPATAQHASRMGPAVANNIRRVLRSERPEAFEFKMLGTLAALGCRTAVAKVMGVKLSGFVAWWLWRTVYLMKMPGWGRRLRIALDWTIDLLFRRDYVQLGVHRADEPPTDATAQARSNQPLQTVGS